MAATEVDFQGWCEEAATRFLQSVLVVDDLATFDTPPVAGKAVEPDPDAVATSEEEEEGAATRPPEIPLDVKTLGDSFADRGLVCGVLRPDEGEPNGKRVVPAATRADIVLLDWRLHDKGERVLDFIAELAACAGLRLIVVYTSAGGLADIATTIAEKLRGLGECEHEPDSFRVTSASLVVEVYSKEGVLLSSEEKEREVTVDDLADHVISDFVEITRGLVSSAAVAAIGELRAATPRILHNLGADLDPGYLGHRLLLPDPDESGDQLIELIASELAVAIEDNELVRRAVGVEIIDAYIDQLKLDDNELSAESLKQAVRVGITDQAAKDELNRIDEVSKAKPKLVGAKVSQTKRFTARDESSANRSDQEFAMKLLYKTTSSTVLPRLTLGTIVKEGEGPFLICVQPGCDSVRLDGPRSFLFLPMRPPKTGKAPDLLINDGQLLELEIVRDPYALRMIEFEPDSATRAVVADRDGADLQFKGPEARLFTFVAQLRKGHAQDAAHQLAQKLGRVAVDRSEVQQLWKTRGSGS